MTESTHTRPGGTGRTLLAGLLLAGLVASASPAPAQTIGPSTYPLSVTSGVALEDLSSGSTLLIAPNVDEGVSAVTPIGFDFWFAGARYTQFSVDSNGLLRLGPTAVTATATNDLATATNLPKIAPYWDNLVVGTNGKVHALVVGAAADRALVVEWTGLQVPRVGTGTAGAATLQCRLHETTGAIEFVYGPGVATNAGGASIGFGASATSFASVTAAGSSVAYGAANNANTTALAAGTRYAFTPPVPSAPTTLAFSNVASTAMTLEWTDTATNETGFAIERSTDGVSFSFAGLAPANSTSSLQSGLAPQTTYTWRVRAVAEGALSAAVEGTQATIAAGTIVSGGSGAWSSTVPDAPWPGGVVPTAADRVTIADGHVVVVNTAAQCLDLVVGQGTSGTLEFEPVTARTLTVGRDAVVTAGGTLRSAETGTQTGHVLSIAGSLRNDGTLDLSTSGDAAGATIAFTGAGDAALSGAGAVTDVRAVSVTKGSGSTLLVGPATLTVRGTTSAGPGFLTLTSGTLRLTGTFALENPFFTAAAYAIPAAAGLWLDAPNVVVTAQAGSAGLDGTLRVSAGTVRVGTANNHSLQLSTGSQLVVEGGRLEVAGRVAVGAAANVVRVTQTGGTIAAALVGNSSASQASVDFGTSASSVVTLTGGTIVLSKASTAGAGPRDWRNEVGNTIVTGGELQLGDESSGAAMTFLLNGTTPGLHVTGTLFPHIARLRVTSAAAGTTRIDSTAALELNGLRFTQAAGDLVNQGTIVASGASSEIRFQGSSAPQTYSGNGTLQGLQLSAGFTVDNPSGVVLDPSLPANLRLLRVNLVRGLLTHANRITLGNADTQISTVQLGTAGSIEPGGTFDVTPTLDLGTGGLALAYAQEGAARVTGAEVPASRTVRNLTVANPAGVVLAGGGLTVTGTLTLTSGVLVSSAGSTLTLTGTSPPAGSVASYVEGPLAVTVTSGSATNRTFAIGAGGAFRPLVLKSVNTGGVARTFTVEVVPGATGGTPVAPLLALAGARYWRIDGSANLNASARVNVTFGPDDNVGVLAEARVAQAGSVAGSYTSLGGTTTGTSSAGTVESNVNLTPGNGYFAVGSIGSLATAWDGGAGTTAWGDAANWQPDGIPGPTTSVSLSFAVPTTIEVNGSFALNNLTVGNLADLRVVSGGLTAGGFYNQSGGTASATGGDLAVTGTLTVSGGALGASSGTVSAGGTVTLSGGSVTLSGTGRLLANGNFTLSGSSVSLGTGTLEVLGNFTRSGGTFAAQSGTTIFSGTNTQMIGGPGTFHDLVLRNGGSGKPKRFTAELSYAVTNTFTVENTAQLALSTSDATFMPVGGDFYYSGLPGGANLSGLRLELTGTDRVIAGVPSGASALAAAPDDDAAATGGGRPRTSRVELRTDPSTAERLPGDLNGKPALRLENTYARRAAEVEQLLTTTAPDVDLVIDLDDATVLRNAAPTSGTFEVATATSELGMPVSILGGARYALGDNLAMASGRSLSVAGRLDCGTWTIGGAGSVAVQTAGVLATATSSPAGLGGTVVTGGADTYFDGSVIEYGRLGDQTVNATNHPGAAMIRLAGSGTKTLDGDKTITGSSGPFLDQGAIDVAAGTTFDDGGHLVSFTTPQFANVLARGGWVSSGSGGLSFQSGTFGSNILAADGTRFGELRINFDVPTFTIDLNAEGTADVTFRNVVFGGTAGSGVAGGTLRLNETGTTNVVVEGSVTIAPRDSLHSGGGFGGTPSTAGRVTLRGGLASTSRAAAQPLFDAFGTNVLRFDGSTRQTLALQGRGTILSGATLELTGPAGLALGGPGVAVEIGPGGTLDLLGHLVVTALDTLALASTAVLDPAGGRIVGALKKPVATGATTIGYEIGSETDGTPVTLAFGQVTAAGSATASSRAGDHPGIAGSGLDSTRTLGRTYAVTNQGVAFDSCAVTFGYPPSELDPGADPESLVVRKFDAPTWRATRTGARTPTSVEARGLTSFSEFAIGEAFENVAPVLSGVPDSAVIDEGVAYSFTAAASDADLPPQVLVYSLVGAPEGASIDAATGVFTWTPDESQGPGTYAFTLRVSDGETTDDAATSLRVAEANVAPTLADVPANATLAEGDTLAFTAHATDPDLPEATLTFSLVDPPAGASIDPSTGAFAWTPTEAQGPGTSPFSVRVSDGVATTDAATSVTVEEVNVAPVIAGVPATATIAQGKTLSFTASATDADLPAQSIVFSLVDAPPGAGIDETSGAFEWTPSVEQATGPYPFAVRASDGVTTTDAALVVTVAPANFAPTLEGVPATASVPEGSEIAFTATASDEDVPAQTLTFSLVGAPAGAAIDATTGVFAWTPTEAQGPGESAFAVRVSDGIAATDAPVTITVTEVNVAPSLAGVPDTATTPELVAFTFTATASDPDLPAQPLTFSLVGAPAGAAIDATTGAFAWTPAEAQGPGEYAFAVRVSDGTAVADAPIVLTVTDENGAPALAGVPATAAIPELAAFTFTATATDGDLPAQTLTFSLVGAPAGATIDATTGAFAWTPTEAQGPGEYAFAVRVSDGVSSTDGATVLTVTEANVGPALAGVPASATIPELATFMFTATASDDDLPPQPLAFSLVGAPAGATIDATSGAFAWTPSEAQGPGEYAFAVRVGDGVGGTDAPVTLSVSEVNTAPAIAGVPATATIPEQSPYAFTATATDDDLPAQPIVFSLVGAPAGAAIDGASGGFTWTPSEAQGPGEYVFAVRASDGTAVAESPISITVTDENVAPTLAGVPATATIPELEVFAFTATASDGDLPAQVLAFSLVGAPTGAAIDATTGAFTWTPTEAQGPGAYAFAVRVSDGTASSDAPILLNVTEANLTPTLAGVAAAATISEQAPYTFTATATDDDVPAQALGFSLVGGPEGAAIDATTGAFTWTPSEAQGAGEYTFAVRVSDGAASTDAAIALTVTESNVAPSLAGVPATATIPEQAPYAFTATATDDDLPAQPLSYSLVGAPAGAMIDPSTGAFAWTPGETQGPGEYTFAVRVSDGVTSTDATTILTVSEANVAPIVAGVPGTATVAELDAVTFTATATDDDVPAQALAFSLAGAPTGASIDANTGAFAWTPGEAQGPGEYAFLVRASDGTATADAPITITVTEANLAPSLAGVPETATIPELDAFGFTATAADGDLPPQALAFSLVGAPAGAAIDASSGVFTWTPSEAQGPGEYAFAVRVSDGVTSTDAPTILTVTEANSPPAPAGVPATATLAELEAFAFTATATDGDLPAQALAFSLVGAPAGATIDGTTGVFAWTPTEAEGPGEYAFAVRVSDGVTATDAATILTVTEANVAPSLAGVPATATIPELDAFTFTATASDGDVPPQPLAFSLVGAPAGAVIDGTTGQFMWTPSEAQGPGEYAFTVRVSDGISSTDAPIALTVTESNLAPAIAGVPATATIPEQAPYAFTATATDNDLPAQPIIFSLVGAPAGAAIDGTTGTFTWIPTEAQGPGEYAFAVRANDGTASADAPIVLTVTDENVAPAIANVPPAATIPELEAYAFTATATDADLPVQALTFSLVGAPAGAAIDATTGAFTWTPSEAQGPGEYAFAVRVSDGTASTDAPIALTVTEANVAPAIAGVPATATIPEQAPYAFTATASDDDLPAQPLAFSLVGAPAGATIDPTTGAFTWTPSEAQGPGEYAFAVRVSDGTASADASIAVTVTEANLAPAIAGVPATATIPEQAPYGFTATATDGDLPAQPLSFSLVGAPAGASIDATTGSFTWTPTEAQGPGEYAFAVRVSDGTASADAPIVLTVTEANVAPVLAGVPPTAAIPELEAYAFTATATDDDAPAQPLSFSLVGAPAGATIDGTSGAFTWTPSEAQGPGEYAFAVRLSDGVATADAPIVLTVTEANVAPAIAGVPSTATIPEQAPYVFTATATDGDLPAQPLSFSLVGAPAGASIDATTGSFTWTPTEAQGPGEYAFAVRLSDGVATADAPIVLTVTEANVAPAIVGVPATATIPEQAPYAFTATATDGDLPAQPLSFSLVGAPAGATIDGTSGAFTWTPSEAQGPGEYAFAVRVSDGTTSSDAPIAITVVETNLAPVLADVPATATFPELQASTFTAAATDADLPPQALTFSLVGAPTGAAIDANTGAFTWTPSEAQGPAEYAFAVRVSDGTASADAPIALTVTEANLAPALAGVPATATIPEQAPYAFTATATDDDLPAQVLAFSLVGAPAGAAIDGSTGAFTWTPTEAQGPGEYAFTVRVSDGTASTDAPITVTVAEANGAPVLAGVPSTATIPELETYAFTASATDDDVPAQLLSFSLVGAPAGATIDGTSGAFTWTPNEAQGPGEYAFAVRVSDGVATMDASITLMVTEANMAPAIAGVPAASTIPELEAYAFTATATDADLPPQALAFSLVGAPAGAAIDATSGAFTWTPAEAQGPGEYAFAVRVSDGTASTDAPVVLIVTEANVAPAIAGVPATATFPEQAPYAFTATATDDDLPAQVLAFSLVGAPAGATIDPTTGAFTWTPSEAQGPGEYAFAVRVSDGTGSTDAPITLTVTEANVAPVLAGVPVSATIPELGGYGFTATASDDDLPAQTLSFSLVGAPTGATIDGTSGAFTWTPSEAQGPGEYAFAVGVSDGMASMDAPITLTVTEANQAPVLAGVPASATIPEQAPYAFTATASDPDLPSQPLVFSLVGAPDGAAIDGATGAFAWTPGEAQGPGEYAFTVRASDGAASADGPIVLTVSEANAAPVVAGVPATATIDELAPYAFTATATDDDVPAQPLAFSLVGAPAGATIDGTTGAFAWTPDEAQGPGEYTFAVRASDGVTATDAPIALTVTEANAAPVLSDVPASATIPEQATYAFTATVTDGDVPPQPLTFSLVGAPAGATIDAVTGAFAWTPAEAQGPGTYPFAVRVGDGVTITDVAVTLTVTEANVAPVLAGVPPTVTAAEQTAITFTASASDADLPAQTLTFSLSGAPAGASIHPVTGAFTWTPGEAQGPGVHTFSVVVGDGPTTTSTPTTITVNEVNVTPAIAGVPSSATTPELAPYTFTAVAADPDIPVQTLTFSLDGAPPGASIHPTTGVFTWTPTETQGPGLYPILVLVSDGVASRGSGIFLTVSEVNVAPSLAGVPATATIAELATLSFTATATDPDLPAQVKTFSLVGAPAGATIGATTGIFSWTPMAAQGPGSYPFEVRVGDGVTTTSAAIVVTVEEPALVAIADLEAVSEPSGTAPPGTFPIRVRWTPTPPGTTVEVYRAPFGGYPRYDDAGGATPPLPSYPPPSPWVLTAATTPDALDTPGGRDLHHYVAFVKKPDTAPSPASNVTAGVLNYRLGDVSDGAVLGQGDNKVGTADLSFLGGHYGISGPDAMPWAVLDVGPTGDGTTTGRPLTDGTIDFEDLVMFSLNFDAMGAWASKAPPTDALASAAEGPDELRLDVPASPGAGSVLAADLVLHAGGAIQGISVRLAWDPGVVQPAEHTLGGLAAESGAILLSPRPGTVDVALLGARSSGLVGEGTLATVSFTVLTDGDPKIRIESVSARDASNREVTVLRPSTGATPKAPLITGLSPAVPNPFAEQTALAFRLVREDPVELTVYAANGRRVRLLERGTRPAGEHVVAWDGRDDGGRRVGAGVYFARLRIGTLDFRQSLVIVR